jgi:hypothetical protein
VKKILLILVAILIQVAACVSTNHRPNISAVPATPMDPVSGILAAFEKHSIVALGEGAHNNEQAHSFRLSLIRDPRFAATVNDIVVEFGAAQNQGTIDRFVNGEDVSDSDFKKIWLDTTQPFPVWDVPIYEEFFRAVRAVNMSLPKDKRLRVLLGDPPVDWDNYTRDYDRDGHAAELIKKEVLTKNRRALVIYGDFHFFRRQPTMVDIKDGKEWPRIPNIPSLVARVEQQSGIKVYTIRTYTEGGNLATLQPEAKSWPAPSFIRLKGTLLGAQTFGFFLPGPVLAMSPDGVEHELKVLPEFAMEEQFDALLYLGPFSSITTSKLAASLCLDPAYIKMRKRRAEIDAPGMAKAIEEMIKTECEEVLKKDPK